MDDDIGTVRPDDPSAFTMHLDGDGSVHMKLDCNRAMGTWVAEPSRNGSRGRFEFGPLAVTRALCPHPNLDERIAAHAEYVRSYLLEDGRLYLSLMADGGVYAWEPFEENESQFLAEPDEDLEAAILDASPDYTREIVEYSSQEARYVYGRVDLNADGSDEVFVYPMGSVFCGTGGCTLLLFTETGSGYSLVNAFPISRLPVVVSPETTGGWNDLVRLESGGGAEPSYVRHAFDGKGYVARERFPVTNPPQGVRYLAGKPTFDRGVPLKPRN